VTKGSATLRAEAHKVWTVCALVLVPSILLVVPASNAEEQARAEAVEVASPSRGSGYAAGPLVVSEDNPRYFTISSGNRPDRRVVYLTGSHIWNNFHDGLGPGFPCASEQNDFDAYLEFLESHGHNFIRLWRWEHFTSQAAGGGFHLCMTPQPWPRTGPGVASDGAPRFDLSEFDQAYFDRLRDRVIAAGNRGIYVSVMLFDGFCLTQCQRPDNVAGHPFAAGNNTDGIIITSISDYQVLPIDPRIEAIQEAYIRKVVDTVHDLPNVLYEVANESTDATSEWGDSTEWQYGVIDHLKEYEAQMGYERHPVGMTFQIGTYGTGPNGFPSQLPDAPRNARLFESPADWISPGFEEEYFVDPWFTNPPSNDGTKVVISDTDHYASVLGEPLWAWKSFLRGHNPILMDFGIIDVVNPLDPSLGVPSYESYEPTRFAMGDTRRFAERVDLVEMEPRGDLSSTGYVLADPGNEYLVLQPSDTPDPLTVSLAAGRYSVRWYSVLARRNIGTDKVTAASPGATTFEPSSEPDGPVVLYLRRVGR
jgi:hypothetical protein